MLFSLLFITAIIVDLIVGDPRWKIHPVRIIGLLCEQVEIITRQNIQRRKLAGIVSVIIILSTVFFVVTATLFFLGKINILFQNLVAVSIIYFSLATRDLIKHSKDVYTALHSHNSLDPARIALAKIVGRDTSHLKEEEISKACIETVSENMVDGVTSPIFWAIVFSLVPLTPFLSAISSAAIGIIFYKTINTMDSMFGYKNEKYLEFGWAAAKFDDLANYIPSRLSGICVIIGSFFTHDNVRKSFSIFRRDRLNHPSPNAAHTEAAVAGALGVQLGGKSTYFGKIVNKPTLGNPSRPATTTDILRTNRLVLVSSLFFCALLLLLRIIFSNYY